MVQRNTVFSRSFWVMLPLLALLGCSSINEMMESDRIDYKSASKSQASRLEVPPDLTQLQRDNRYAIPTAGTITASDYTQQQATRPANQVTVATRSMGDIRVERAGNQRWLVVRKSPETLWPQIKEFWQDSGFLINVDRPEVGVMETDWAENRAKIPQDFLRKTIGKVLDSLYSTGERDKFRTRLERAADGSTEIYISHRGMQEELIGNEKASAIWVPRQPDPELEAEFLSRLMVRLGVERERAKAVATAQAVRGSLATLVKGEYVEVSEGFDRTWRRVGLALDRVGFTVEDRDRSQGLYYVRYVDQEDTTPKNREDKGFLSRWFSFGGDSGKKAQRYRISVKQAGEVSRVTVLSNEGRPEKSPVGDRILSLLQEQLK
ncbi:MAG: bamC [Burkholderiaceae bacterium]|nr:bamC [Burkholderiaceae bacterium]